MMIYHRKHLNKLRPFLSYFPSQNTIQVHQIPCTNPISNGYRSTQPYTTSSHSCSSNANPQQTTQDVEEGRLGLKSFTPRSQQYLGITIVLRPTYPSPITTPTNARVLSGRLPPRTSLPSRKASAPSLRTPSPPTRSAPTAPLPKATRPPRQATRPRRTHEPTRRVPPTRPILLRSRSTRIPSRAPRRRPTSTSTRT